MHSRFLYHAVCGLVLISPVQGFAQAPDRRDFSRLVWEVAVHGGVNATQVGLVSDASSHLSNGYNGFSFGGGILVLPRRFFAFELDAMYSGRVFGFGSSKGFFNSLQTPLLAQLRLGPLRLGGGVYGAFWSQKGKIVEGSSSAEVSPNEVGNEPTEFGYVSQIGFTTTISNIPVRFEFRALTSLTDVAKSPTFKGSIEEYQFLVGYDFDTTTRLPWWQRKGNL